MIRYFSLLLFFFLEKNSARAQSAGSSFTLEGTMNTDPGTMELMQMGSDHLIFRFGTF